MFSFRNKKNCFVILVALSYLDLWKLLFLHKNDRAFGGSFNECQISFSVEINYLKTVIK